jgi:hypothetical protein
VTTIDLCLDPTLHAKASVFISDVFQINLNVVDKVRSSATWILIIHSLLAQVEIHKEIVARVQVLDRQGQAIPRQYFNLMNLQPVLGSDIISVRLENKC